MSKTKLLSVIVPHRNQNRSLIIRAISSLYEQEGVDFSSLELIVVDDHSDEEHKLSLNNIVKKFKAKNVDLEVFVLKNQNMCGQGNAMNTGIRKGKADYYALLDTDDYYKPNAIKTVLEKIKTSKDSDIIFSNHLKVNLRADKVLYLTNKKPLFELHNKYKNTLLDPLFHMSFIVHLITVRKNAWERVDGYKNIAPGQDHDFQLRVAQTTKKINFSFIPDCLYVYRSNPHSTTGSNRSDNLRVAKYGLLSFLQEYDYPVTSVKYKGKIGPTNSSYYDLYISGNKVDIPWYGDIKKQSIY